MNDLRVFSVLSQEEYLAIYAINEINHPRIAMLVQLVEMEMISWSENRMKVASENSFL